MMVKVEDLFNGVDFYDAEALGLTRDALLLRKLDELTPEFMDSCERVGIISPLCYDSEQNMIHEGCHRLIVAYMLGIKEIEALTYLEYFNTDFLDAQDEMELPFCAPERS
jgi:hypothetical protein